MDLLDCETRSRCHECHQYSSAAGCLLAAAVAAYEASLAPRAAPAAAPALSWADTRGTLTLAEA